MSTIVLIRAGCTDYEDAHRLLGNLSVPLNARGTGQVREIVQRLQQDQLPLEVILTSPENPASCTAHEVARAFPRLKVKQVEELRNVNQGLWQGLPENDVRRRFPRFFVQERKIRRRFVRRKVRHSRTPVSEWRVC